MQRNTRSNSVSQETVQRWADKVAFIRQMNEDLVEARERENLALGQDEDRLAADAYRNLATRLEIDLTAELTNLAETLLLAGSGHER